VRSLQRGLQVLGQFNEFCSDPVHARKSSHVARSADGNGRILTPTVVLFFSCALVMKVPPTPDGRGTGGMHFIEFDYSFSLALVTSLKCS